jgi:hypothetical protein
VLATKTVTFYGAPAAIVVPSFVIVIVPSS